MARLSHPQPEPEAFHFFRGADISPQIEFDDLIGMRRGFLHFASLMKKAVLSSLRAARPAKTRHEHVIFAMHRTKYAQLAPFANVLAGKPLYLLAPWSLERITEFNAYIQASDRDWQMLEPAFPPAFWRDAVLNLPRWVIIALGSPRLAARRVAQFAEFYGLAYGIFLVVERAGAKAIFSSYEDTPWSGTATQILRGSGVISVNTMHGNCYPNRQYFDYSLVFGAYHKRYLETQTGSSSQFVISGSATIADSGARPRPESAAKLLYFDQTACDMFPPESKSGVLEMLAAVLDGVPGTDLTVKPHPAGADAYLDGFLVARPSVARLQGNSGKSVAETLDGYGISLCCFSTTGLEAIGNAVVSLFLNPGNKLSAGPLAFMGEFVITSDQDLVPLVRKLISDPDFYRAYLDRERRVLGEFYSLGKFDHAGFLRKIGVLGASAAIS